MNAVPPDARTGSAPSPPIRRIWQCGLLLLLATILTFAGYGGILDDAGVLRVSDDLIHFTFVADGISLCELFISRIDHVAPLIRLGYFAMYTLVGFWWLPYGLMLLGAHALTVALIGTTVATVARSFVAGLAATLMLTLSHAFFSGVMQNWIYVFIYLEFSLVAAAVLLTNAATQHPPDDGTDRRWPLAALFAVTAIALFNMTPGVVILPAVMLLALARGATTRQVVRLAVAVGTGFGLWLIVMAATWLLLGNPLPGTWRYDTTGVGQPFATKLGDGLTWGLIGLYLPSLPIEVLQQPNALTLTLLSALTLIFLACWRRGVAPGHARVGLAALAMLLFYAVLAARGRDTVAFWHMRYNGYGLIFGLLAQASLLGIGLTVARRLDRHGARRLAAPVLAGAVLLLSAAVLRANVSTVVQSDFFVHRATMWRDAALTTDHSQIRDCSCRIGARTRVTREEMMCLIDT